VCLAALLLIKSFSGKSEFASGKSLKEWPINPNSSMKSFLHNDRFEKAADLASKAPAKALGLIVIAALVISWLPCEPFCRLAGRIKKEKPVKKPVANFSAKGNQARTLRVKLFCGVLTTGLATIPAYAHSSSLAGSSSLGLNDVRAMFAITWYFD
jgi:hypothetical protein